MQEKEKVCVCEICLNSAEWMIKPWEEQKHVGLRGKGICWKQTFVTSQHKT